MDRLASLLKGGLGMVPFAGSMLSELVGNIIPNQRIDRLTKYAIELDERLSMVPIEILNKLKSDEEFIDLIEESFFQASRAITDERRKYIASIVTKGLTNEAIRLEESKYLLKLLQELNDIEVILLKLHYGVRNDSDWEFRKLHEGVLYPITTFTQLTDRNEKQKKTAFKETYDLHLERLGLIFHRYRMDSMTKTSKQDPYKGKPRISGTDTTHLGKMLLEQIGII